MNRDLPPIHRLRKEYEKRTLEIQEVHKNPLAQFSSWFEDALTHKEFEANAMTLATADASGRPSARIVLLKGFDEKGFVWFTNYSSKKGRDLAENPFAALVFHWEPLERQIRIEGRVSRLSDELSDEYFNSRPRGSRIGAIASPQSSIIEDRSVLEEKVEDLQNEYGDNKQIPRPENWGGYVIDPDRVEFWQGRPSRLHDRITYLKEGNSWKIVRQAP